MKKKKSYSKMQTGINMSATRHKSLTCSLCDFEPSYSGLDAVLVKSLNKKYSTAELQCCEGFNLERFVSGVSQVFPGGFLEFKKYYQEQPNHYLLKDFYGMNDIKSKITKVINERLQRDKYFLLHYSQPYYQILRRNQKLQILCFKEKLYKKISIKTPKGKSPVLKTNLKLVKSKKEKSQKKLKKILGQKEQINHHGQNSEEEIRSLSKDIEKMCNKFHKKKLLLTPAKERHSSNPQIKRVTSYRQFKQQLLDQFSFINKYDSPKKSPKVGQKKIETKDQYPPHEEYHKPQNYLNMQKSPHHSSRRPKKEFKQAKQLYGLQMTKKTPKIDKEQPHHQTKKNAYSSQRYETQYAPCNIYDSPATGAYYNRQIYKTETGQETRSKKKHKRNRILEGIQKINKSKSVKSVKSGSSSSKDSHNGRKFFLTLKNKKKLISPIKQPCGKNK